MHYNTALSESKSVKNVGVISNLIFFHRHLLRELIGLSGIDLVLSTTDALLDSSKFLHNNYKSVVRIKNG